MVELLLGVGEFLFGAGEAGAGLFAAGEAGAAGLGAAELGAAGAEFGAAEAGISAAEAATLAEEGFDFTALEGGGGAFTGGEAFGIFGPGAEAELFQDVYPSLIEQGFAPDEARQLAMQIADSARSGSLSVPEIQETFQSVGYRDPFAGVSPSGEVVTGQFEGFGTTGGESAGESAGGAADAGIGADSNASVEGIGNSASTAGTTAPGETAAEVGAAAEAEAAADAAAANAAGGQTGAGLGGQVGGQVGAGIGSIGPAEAGSAAATGVAQGVGATEAFGPDVVGLGPDVVQALAQEPVDVAPNVGAGSFQGPAAQAGPASTASTTTQGGFSDPASFLGSPQAVTPGTAEPGIAQGETLGATAGITGTEDAETLTGLAEQDVFGPPQQFNTDITETPDPGVTDTRGSFSSPGLTGPGSFSTTETARGVAEVGPIGSTDVEMSDTISGKTDLGPLADTLGREAFGPQEPFGPPAPEMFGPPEPLEAFGPQEPFGPPTPEMFQVAPEPITAFGPTPEELDQLVGPREPGIPFGPTAQEVTDSLNAESINALGRGADEGFTGRSGFAESPNVSITSAPVDPTTDFSSVETDPDVLAQEPNPSINQAQALGENAARGAAAAPGIEDSGTYSTGKDAAGFTDQGTYDTAAAASGAGGGLGSLLTPTNALLAGGLTASALGALLAGKKAGGAATQLPPTGQAAASNATTNAATQQAAGTSELARAINLDLTPAEQALLAQQARDRGNRQRQLESSAGIDPEKSTMFAQQEALSQEQTLRDTQGFIQNHFQQGMALLGGSTSANAQLVNLSAQQIKLQADFDALLQQTTANFASTLVKVGAVASGARTTVAV